MANKAKPKLKKKTEKIDIDAMLAKETIIPADMAVELKDAILNYAIEVISDRALPDVYDGCKPVQRRILYNGLYKRYLSSGKYIKCAQYVGDTMGLWHCHGDSSIYLALTALSQPWTTRYAMIDFHGNNGSYDGDPPASSRYTEARLAKLGEVMVDGINNNAVDMKPNYSETASEPKLLPSIFPMLLCNGSSGIAIGYTTEIPSHQLGEVCDAIIATINNKDITLDELMTYIPGPDTCTGAQLVKNEEIKKLYETGKGKLTFKAKYHFETSPTGVVSIVITELPASVSKPKLLEKLMKLCIEDKKIPRVAAIKDLSTKDTKIIVELQKTADPDMVVSSLFDMTELQKDCTYIMRAVKDNTPSLFSLKEMIEHYIIHRQNCIRNESASTLKKTEHRLHINRGLEKLTQNLKKAVRIIEDSDDEQSAKENLMAAFKLDEEQAEAVLEFKLRRLTRLNRDDIVNLVKSLEEEKEKLEELLADENLINNKIIEQLTELKVKYNDTRRTEIIEDIKTKKGNRKTILLLTNKNTIKVISDEALREAIAKNVMKERTEIYTQKIVCKAKDSFIVIFEDGTYIKKDLSSLMALNTKTAIVGLYVMNEEMNDKSIICLTEKGLILKFTFSAFKKVANNTPLFANMTEDDKLIKTKLVTSSKENIITIATKKGILHRFFEASFREQKSTGKQGLQALFLSEDDSIVDFDVSDNNVKVVLYMKGTKGPARKVLSTDDLMVKGRVGKGYNVNHVSDKYSQEVIGMTCQAKEYSDIDTKGRIQNVKLNNLEVSTKVRQPSPIDYEPIKIAAQF